MKTLVITGGSNGIGRAAAKNSAVKGTGYLNSAAAEKMRTVLSM